MDRTSMKRRHILEIILLVIAGAAGFGLLYILVSKLEAPLLQFFTGLVFTLAIAGDIWLFLDPDTHAARQSAELLEIASKTLDAMEKMYFTSAAFCRVRDATASQNSSSSTERAASISAVHSAGTDASLRPCPAICLVMNPMFLAVISTSLRWTFDYIMATF